MSTPPAPAPARSGAPLPARIARTRPGPAARTRALVLSPAGTAPAAARTALRECLSQWQLSHLQDDAGQIASELVANAVTASVGAAPPGTEPRPVTVWITTRDAELCIRVWDPDPAPPPRGQPPPGPLAEHGRGLLIVSALSQRWGSHPAPNGGKYVWASLPLHAQPPAA